MVPPTGPPTTGTACMRPNIHHPQHAPQVAHQRRIGACTTGNNVLVYWAVSTARQGDTGQKMGLLEGRNCFSF